MSETSIEAPTSKATFFNASTAFLVPSYSREEGTKLDTSYSGLYSKPKLQTHTRILRRSLKLFSRKGEEKEEEEADTYLSGEESPARGYPVHHLFNFLIESVFGVTKSYYGSRLYLEHQNKGRKRREMKHGPT